MTNTPDPNQELQNAQSALQKAQKMNAEADTLIRELERKLNRATSKFKGQLNKFEDSLDDLNSREKSISAFQERAENLDVILSKVNKDSAFTAKEAEKVLAILRKTGASAEQFSKAIGQNVAYMGEDLTALKEKMDQAGEDVLKAFDALVDGSEALRKSTKKSAEMFSQVINGAGEELDKLNKQIELYNKRSSAFKLLKEDPSKTFSDFKSMAATMSKELTQFSVDSGLSADSTMNVEIKLREMHSVIEANTLKAQELVSQMTEDNAQRTEKQIKTLEHQTVMQMAMVQKEYKALQEMYSQKRRVMELTAEGMGGLAEESQSVASSISSGLGALRNFNLIDAVRNFKQASKTADTIQKASADIASGSSNSAVRFVASMGKYFKWIAGIAGFLAAIVYMANAARDKAVEINKTLMESQGLAGLGFKLGTNMKYQDMEKELYDIRDEMLGSVGDQVKFAVSGEEIASSVAELGRQGVMVSELRSGGKGVNDALQGVFTYSRLLKHDDQAMANTMGSIATDLGLSMTEVEHRFANMSAEWSGTRLSWDDFIGTVREISSEHGMFGDRMNEVSGLLEMTGKNAMLSSKQALDSVKKTADFANSLDDGHIRSLIEMSGGPASLMKMASERQTALEAELRRRTAAGDKNTGPLKRQIGQLKTIIDMYENKTGEVEYSQVLHMLSTGQQASYLTQAAGKALNLTQEQLYSMTQAELSLATKHGYQAMGALGAAKDQWEALLNVVFSAAGGPDATFGEGIKKVAAIDGNIKDQSDQVAKNREEAAKASAHLMTSAKAWQIATDQLMHKMYLLVMGISDLVGKIVETLTVGRTVDQASKVVDTSLTDFSNTKVGSKEYYDAIKKVLSELEAFKQSGATPEQYQQKIDSLPADFKTALTKILSGQTVSPDDYANKQPGLLADMSRQIRSTVPEEALPGVPKMNPNLSKADVLGAGNRTKAAAVDGNNQLSNLELTAAQHMQGLAGETGRGWEATVFNKQGQVVSRAGLGVDSGGEFKSPIKGYVSAIGDKFMTLKTHDGGVFNLSMADGFIPDNTIKVNTKISQGDVLGKLRDPAGKIVVTALDPKGKEVGAGQFLQDRGMLDSLAKVMVGKPGDLKPAGQVGRDLAVDLAVPNPYVEGGKDLLRDMRDSTVESYNTLADILGMGRIQMPAKDVATTSVANSSSVTNNIDIDVDPYKIVSMLTRKNNKEVRLGGIRSGETLA